MIPILFEFCAFKMLHHLKKNPFGPKGSQKHGIVIQQGATPKGIIANIYS